MTTFNLHLDENDALQVGFGLPGNNDQIVNDCAAACNAIQAQVMGKLLKINGRMSVHAAMVIAHAFCHIVPAIALFDPKLGKFVVVITHSPSFQLGQILD